MTTATPNRRKRTVSIKKVDLSFFYRRKPSTSRLNSVNSENSVRTSYNASTNATLIENLLSGQARSANVSMKENTRTLNNAERSSTTTMTTTSTTKKSEKFARELGLIEITSIGVSCCLSGIYIMIGESVKNESGPSIVVSFLLAGVITLLAGLCYAELAAKEPHCESAYSYTYIIIGEFWAFCMGWNFILQYIIGVSSDARALSQYIDSLFNSYIENSLKKTFPINMNGFSEYPDILGFFLTIGMTGILIIGVKESSSFNKVVNGLNVFVILFIVSLGLTKIDFKNWNLAQPDLFAISNSSEIHQNGNVANLTSLLSIKKADESLNSQASSLSTRTNLKYGSGGFFPFGIRGMIRSVNKCFYAFIGFDTIASTNNEAISPKRNIPLAIILAILICLTCFLGLSSVLTLMMPYYLVSTSTPFSSAFHYVNREWAEYFVSFGIITSISASLYAEMYVMPRIVFSMANDGLIFKFLSRINKTFKTPISATLVTGFLSALFAMMFNLDNLVDMMSLCTLAGYSITSLCLIVIRFMPDLDDTQSNINADEDDDDIDSLSLSISLPLRTSTVGRLQVLNEHPLEFETNTCVNEHNHNFPEQGNQLKNTNETPSVKKQGFVDCSRKARDYLFFFRNATHQPSKRRSTFRSSRLCNILTVLIGIELIFLSFLLNHLADMERKWIYASSVAFIIVLILAKAIFIFIQPQNNNYDTFKVPFVPFVPIMSSFFDIYLMCNLSGFIWLSMLVWLLIGLVLYFAYGLKHSNEKRARINLEKDFTSANDLSRNQASSLLDESIQVNVMLSEVNLNSHKRARRVESTKRTEKEMTRSEKKWKKKSKAKSEKKYTPPRFSSDSHRNNNDDYDDDDLDEFQYDDDGNMILKTNKAGVVFTT